jgi:hypothetical protein
VAADFELIKYNCVEDGILSPSFHGVEPKIIVGFPSLNLIF